MYIVRGSRSARYGTGATNQFISETLDLLQKTFFFLDVLLLNSAALERPLPEKKLIRSGEKSKPLLHGPDETKLPNGL